jgi:lipopolysaccharide transport system permease protein
MSLEVRTYSSDKAQNNLKQTIKTLLREFPAAHSLGFRFAERSIRTRYRQSVFGMLWAFLPPLATAAIWIILDKYKVVKFADVGAPYPLFVTTGMLLWSVFANSLLMPMQTMQANRSILVKINFPRESLIINAFYEILFNATISLIIIAVFMLVYKVHLTLHCLLFFPVLLVMMFLGMSLGLLLLPFSLLYKDIQFILPSILQFAMYLTPVVYAQPIYQGAGRLLSINPVSPLLTNARAWLLGINTSVPPWHLVAVACASIFLLIVGIFLQRKTMEILIERMGS